VVTLGADAKGIEHPLDPAEVTTEKRRSAFRSSAPSSSGPFPAGAGCRSGRRTRRSGGSSGASKKAGISLEEAPIETLSAAHPALVDVPRDLLTPVAASPTRGPPARPLPPPSRRNCGRPAPTSTVSRRSDGPRHDPYIVRCIIRCPAWRKAKSHLPPSRPGPSSPTARHHRLGDPSGVAERPVSGERGWTTGERGTL